MGRQPRERRVTVDARTRKQQTCGTGASRRCEDAGRRLICRSAAEEGSDGMWRAGLRMRVFVVMGVNVCMCACVAGQWRQTWGILRIEARADNDSAEVEAVHRWRRWRLLEAQASASTREIRRRAERAREREEEAATTTRPPRLPSQETWTTTSKIPWCRPPLSASLHPIPSTHHPPPPTPARPARLTLITSLKPPETCAPTVRSPQHVLSRDPCP